MKSAGQKRKPMNSIQKKKNGSEGKRWRGESRGGARTQVEQKESHTHL